MDIAENRCVLGFTSNKPVGGTIKKWESKLFGSPVWQDEQSAPTRALCCGICGSKMLFVCQLYAPVEEAERSLYAFVCPRETCSMRSAGWRIIRNQAPTQLCQPASLSVGSNLTTSAVKLMASTVLYSAVKPVGVSVSSAPSKTNTEKAKAVVASDWGLEEDDDDDLSELLDMISTREDKQQHQRQQQVNKTNKAKHQGKTNSACSGNGSGGGSGSGKGQRPDPGRITSAVASHSTAQQSALLPAALTDAGQQKTQQQQQLPPHPPITIATTLTTAVTDAYVEAASGLGVCLVALPEWRLCDDSAEGGEPAVPSSVIQAAPSMGGPSAVAVAVAVGGGGSGGAEDSEGAYIRGEDDDDEDEDDDGGSSGGDDARILAMLDSYAEDPENLALVQTLKAGLGRKKSGNQNQNQLQSQSHTYPVKSRYRAVDPKVVFMYPSSGITLPAAGSGNVSGAAGGSSASKAQQSYRLKLENYFHRRVSFHPQQVLRYGYGLQPLWCSVLFRDMFPRQERSGPGLVSNGSSGSGTGSGTAKKRDPAVVDLSQIVPCCGSCRAARVFEFQLMPALLTRYAQCKIVSPPTTATTATTATPTGSEISTVPVSTTPSTTSAAVATHVADGGIGLEFGVVCVFVCPNSCIPCSSNTTTGSEWEECAIVQPPADMIAI